jgi:hypothetical protein
MRKQGANTHLGFWLSEIVLGLAIFFMDRVVRLDGHGRKRIAALRNLVPDRKVISRIREQRQYHAGANNAEEYAFQASLSLTGLESGFVFDPRKSVYIGGDLP